MNQLHYFYYESDDILDHKNYIKPKWVEYDSELK